MSTTRRIAQLGIILAIGLLLAMMAVALGPTRTARAVASSQKIALVPDDGSSGSSQPWPTSGFPNGYAPSFTNLTEAAIQGDVTDPIAAGGYDTVVLMQTNDLPTRMANATFKARLQSFVTGGGKLIIQPIGDNTAHQNINYSNFFYPMQTANNDTVDTLTNVENSTLASSNASSPNFINNLSMFQSDSVTDGAEMSTCDQHWYATQVAYQGTTVKGPTTAYAELGSGLIVYAAYDNDVFSDQANGGYGASNPNENVQLRRMWLFELLQPANPDGLPRSVKIFGVTVNPENSTVTAGVPTTFTAHATNKTVGVAGKTINFSVTSGPDAGKTGSGVTNASGDAPFTFTPSAAGADVVTATVQGGMLCVDQVGVVSETAALAVTAAPSPSPTPPALPKAGEKSPSSPSSPSTSWTMFGVVGGTALGGLVLLRRQRLRRARIS